MYVTFPKIRLASLVKNLPCPGGSTPVAIPPARQRDRGCSIYVDLAFQCWTTHHGELVAGGTSSTWRQETTVRTGWLRDWVGT